MDLNKLRDELQKSRPVRVTRMGRLYSPDKKDAERKESPTRLKPHTFAQAWHIDEPERFDEEQALMERFTDAELLWVETVSR